MNAIHGVNQTQPNYDYRSERSERSEAPANGELLTPANYSVVGGTFELLMLMLEVNKAAKDGARTEATAADLGAKAAEAEQVSEMRAKANASFAGAILQSGSTMASAAISLQATQHAAKVRSDAGGLDDAAGRAAEEHAQSLLRNGDNYAKMTEATGGLHKAVADHVATGHDIDATKAQNRAAALNRSAQQLQSDLDDLKGSADKLIAYARDIEAARNRCTQIALQAR